MKFGMLVNDGLSVEEYAELAKHFGEVGIKCLKIVTVPIIDTATNEVVTKVTEAIFETSWFNYELCKIINGLVEHVGFDGWHILSLK